MSAAGQMCAIVWSAKLVPMTNDNPSRRRWLAGAAVAVFAAGVTGRELIRSGTVAGDLLSQWYGRAGLTVAGLAVVFTGLYLLHRAYRS